jgi:hypothetical protein
MRWIMKNKNSILDTIKSGCLIFTVITVLSYIAGTLLSSENKAFIPTLKWILLFLLFSLVLAFANMLLRLPNAATGARLGFHFLATAALYFVVVVLCGGFIASGAQTIIAMLLFCVLYGIFAAIFAITSGTKRKKKNKEEKYDSMFN